MSMPLSSGSFSSSSVRPARPPPNSVLNVTWKLALMAVNASRKRACVVSSMRVDRFGGLRDRVDQVLALRGQEHVALSSSSNCSMAIMFTGPRRSIFARSAAIASSAVIRRPRSPSLPTAASARSRRSSPDPASVAGSSSCSSGSGSLGGTNRARVGLDLRPPLPSRSTSREPRRASPARRPSHSCARCVRSLSAVARCTSSFGGERAHASRARRASRMTSSCSSDVCLIVERVLVGDAASRSRRASSCRRRRPSGAGRRRSRSAGARAARCIRRNVADACLRRAARARAPPLRAARTSASGPTRARPGRRARRGLPRP